MEWGSASDGTRIYVAISNYYGIPLYEDLAEEVTMTPAPTGVLRRIAVSTPILALLAASAAWAQDHQPATQAAETIEFVKTGLFMVSGGGGNTAVRLSGNGMILSRLRCRRSPLTRSAR
jgi:hypothetical protein